MSFSRIRGSGLWVDNSTIAQFELETLDENQSNAVDGAGGGAYAPTAAIEIGGEGLECSVVPSEGTDVANKNYADRGATNFRGMFQNNLAGPANGVPMEILTALDVHTAPNIGGGWAQVTNSGGGVAAIQVPVAGQYLVSFFVQFTTTTAGAGLTFRFAAAIGGNPTTGGGTRKLTAASRRIANDIAHPCEPLHRTGVVKITDPATQRITFEPRGVSGTFQLGSHEDSVVAVPAGESENVFSIVYLGPILGI